MKALFSFTILFLFSIDHNYSRSFLNDSLIQYKPIYTNKEYKKEKKDIKAFEKTIKAYEKSISSHNIDLINMHLANLKSVMMKETNELNGRITARTKRTRPAKQIVDTLNNPELPKGYNPSIEGQIINTTKSEILEKRSETEILIKYSKVLNKENQIIRKLGNISEVNSDTPSSSFEEILKDAKEFKELMKSELYNMSFEKGKKKSK